MRRRIAQLHPVDSEVYQFVGGQQVTIDEVRANFAAYEKPLQPESAKQVERNLIAIGLLRPTGLRRGGVQVLGATNLAEFMEILGGADGLDKLPLTIVKS